MAYEPRRWAVGLIPVAMLWAVGTLYERETIEADLSHRSAAALGAGLIDAPHVSTAGRDVTLSGAAFAPEAPAAAAEAVLALSGVRLVNTDAVTPLAEAKPYQWSALREGAVITLSGYVPNPAGRAALLAAAGAEARDAMVYARGDSAAAGAAGAFALGELALFSRGAASYSDGALTISGTAADSAAYEAAATMLAKPPAGVTVVKADIQPPRVSPYVFSAAQAGGSVRLSGVAPTFAARDALAAAAAAAFPGAKMDNAIRIAAGAPAGDFQGAAKLAIEAMSRLDAGAATIADARLALSGRARAPGELEAVAGSLSGLAPGFVVDTHQIVAFPARPFEFDAIKTDAGVRLAGVVSDASAHVAIEEAADAVAAGRPVVDDTLIASGWPAATPFDEAAKFAIAQLKGLVSGEARLIDGALSVAGEAADEAAAAAARAELAGLPAGLTLAAAEISAPKPAPPPPVVAEPAQPTEPPPVEAAAPPAESTAPPRVEEPPAVAAAPAPAEPLQPAACQSNFKETLASSRIEFDTGKATIAPASDLLLRQLADIALRCADATIEISGHTDSQGDPEMNMALSTARAEAVVAVLTHFGVPASRLVAVGYGETRPIAPNDSEVGRAQNRRIEFSVKD